QQGLTVAVVEKQYWGGVCLNVGCIPSKALLRNAELAHTLTQEKDKFGITGDASMSYGPTHERSRKVSDGIVKGVHFLMKKNKITEVDGWGTITSATTMSVEADDGSTSQLQFSHLIIAAGATTKMLPGVQLSKNVVTYEQQILESELPNSVIIAGSGAIGVEFAYVMKNFGVDVTVSPAAGGDQQVLEADRMLSAIGFSPRVEGYGLENAGVATTERGAIAVDERGRTNVENIFAVGDVTGKLMLAHTAEAM